MCTGQLLAAPVLTAAWIAAVSSCAPSPTAPPAFAGQRTSSQGWPEHINTSPFKVAAPVVERVEKLPGDCASAGDNSRGPGIRRAIRLTEGVNRRVDRDPGCSGTPAAGTYFTG